MRKTVIRVLILIIVSIFCRAHPMSAKNWGYEHLLGRVVAGEICRTGDVIKLHYCTEPNYEIKGNDIFIELFNIDENANDSMYRCEGRAYYLDLMEEDENDTQIVRSFINYYELAENGEYRLGEWKEYYVNPGIVEDDGQVELFIRSYITRDMRDTSSSVTPPLYYTVGVREY